MGKGYDVNGNVVISTSDEDISDLEDLLSDRLLIWHDEFVDGKLDANKWSNLYGYNSAHGGYIYSQDANRNVSVGSGARLFTLKDKPIENAEYSCPYLHTNNVFEFRYGRVEAKIKFPTANPHHSTLWMLGANTDRICVSESEPFDSTKGVLFPSCGEVDMAEFDNGTVGARTYWSQDGFDTDGTAVRGGNVQSLISNPTDWHIYATEWTESSITFYVDGVQKGTWNTSNATVNGWNPFNHPFFLILNCIPYLSGSPTWDVAETQVKWVRVYAPVGVTEYIKETAITIPSALSISVGQRSWLQPTFTPANPSDMTLKWASGNESICTCYGGMVIGVGTGTTMVSVKTKHGLTAFCKVTVS